MCEIRKNLTKKQQNDFNEFFEQVNSSLERHKTQMEVFETTLLLIFWQFTFFSVQV